MASRRHTSSGALALLALCLAGCPSGGWGGGPAGDDAGDEQDTGPPPIDYSRVEFTCGPASTPAPAPFTQLDMLWVIDNSSAMCQEQAALRAHAAQALAPLLDAGVDMHLAVTTTHAPHDSNEGGSSEPVAVEGHIQSTPQPIPGDDDDACLGRYDTETRRYQNLTPLRSALAAAVGCMQTPDPSLLDVTDDQLNCALPKSGRAGCAEEVGGADRTGDASFTLEDVFPLPSEYRLIPKVLRTEDYRSAGAVDLERLIDDLACASLVGTRGSAYEKGIQAAVEATSRTLTGGAVGSSQATESAPNHGLLRTDSAFSVVFVSNENDCSHDGDLRTGFANTCRQDACYFENAAELRGEPSDLTSVCDLADRLRANLTDSKGRAVSDAEVLVASIHGGWKIYDRPLPRCNDRVTRPTVPVACVNGSLGESFTGDRYSRFMRQFPNYYPNALTGGDAEARANFADVQEQGALCSGDIPGAMRGIGESFAALAAP